MKVDKEQVVCILVGITFMAAGFFVDSLSGEGLRQNVMIRNSYGMGEKDETIIVEGLLDKEIALPLRLQERQYTEQEADTAFDKSRELLIASVLGENESLDWVTGDLKLVSRLEDGIQVEWTTENAELIDASGRVYNEACGAGGEKCRLTAGMRAGSWKKAYSFTVTVYPPVKTKEEQTIDGFQASLSELDRAQSHTDKLLLPRSYEGSSLTYRETGTKEYWFFPLLGIAAAALIPVSKRQKEQKKRQQRERQMLLDYSDIVSRLVVFTGAGIPIRKAWERIVRDYEEMSLKEGIHRYAYEEMKGIYYLMARGMPEGKAYAEFGTRCRVLPYRKLAGLLEQNLKNGGSGLQKVLEAEMADAFEQRKTMARRLGEEAGTKLLVPLFMMLAVVMIMVSVPAFLSFSF